MENTKLISKSAKNPTHIIRSVEELPKDMDLYKITSCIKSYTRDGRPRAQFIMQHEFTGRKIRVGKHILMKYNNEL